jgi:hypothetical protein
MQTSLSSAIALPLPSGKAGIDFMSHLSILPTVLRDADRLAASLSSLGLQPSQGGVLRGFDQVEPVEVQVSLSNGLTLGWRRQVDGSLALVGDLQRLSRSRSLQRLLSRVTRAYAARQALDEAAASLSDAMLHIDG